jgi:O-antigen/teichoic acid export membrane protein
VAHRHDQERTVTLLEVLRTVRNSDRAWFASSAVAAGNVATILVGGLTGVICARWLGPIERGHYVSVTIWAAALAVVLSLGLPQSLVVDNGSLARLTRRLGFLLFGLPLIALVLALFLLPLISESTGARRIFGFALIAAGSAAMGIGAGLAQRSGRMTGLFQAVRLTPPLFALGALSLLMLVGNRSADDWLLATGVAIYTAGLSLALHSLGGVTAFRNVAHIDDDFVRLTGGALAMAVLSTCVYGADGLVAAAQLRPERVAEYAIGIAAAGAITAVSQSSGMVAFSRLRHVETPGFVKAVFRYCGQALGISLIVSLVVACFAETIVITLYGEDFRGAVAIVQVLVFASGPIAVDFISSHALQLRREYRFLLTLRAVQLIVFVGGAVWLCNRGDVLGLCWFVLLVFTVSSAIMSAWLAIRNGSDRPYEVGEV